ncbi:MAG: hypothetical protein HGA19_20685, partial [Oscillochloris sp.]|nr:hypothetical protein [Oscillochloris sp.]
MLFARNVDSREQVLDLVTAIHDLPGNPTVAIDLEVGKVNRYLFVTARLDDSQFP